MINRHNLVYYTLTIVFWLYATIGFVSEEVLPPLASVRPVLTLLLDGVIALMGLALLRARNDVWIVISFAVIAVLSAYVNHTGMMMFMNGFREFVGVLFVLPVMRFLLSGCRGAEFQRKFDRQLYIFLWVQVFCLVEQFVRYGANDHGGGSFGNFSSGAISTAIYTISFYLMTRRWNQDWNYAQNLAKNWVLIFLLFPTLLNETKVSFVYLLIYFLLLFKLNRAYVFKVLCALPFMVAALIAVGYFYIQATGENADYVFSADTMEMYLAGGDAEDEFIEIAQMAQDNPGMEDINDWIVDLPRFTKIFMMDNLLKTERGGMLLGAGLGQFKGGTMVQSSEFAKTNDWYLRGTRPLTVFLFIQLGWLGFIWYLMTMWTDFNMKHNYGGALGKNVQWFILLLTLIFLFYIDAIRNLPLCVILFYVLATSTVQRGESCENEQHGDESSHMPQLR